jgi:hypothetical protein
MQSNDTTDTPAGKASLIEKYDLFRRCINSYLFPDILKYDLFWARVYDHIKRCLPGIWDGSGLVW